MTSLIFFNSKRELSAIQNREEFVRMCRYELTVFGQNLDWSCWRWRKVAHFTRLGSTTARASELDAFDCEFIDFSKAYFRYQQGHKPTGTKNELKALKCVERALVNRDGRGCPSRVSIGIMDEAARIARSYYSPGVAYHAGRELQRLAHFMSSNDMAGADLGTWRSPIPRNRDERIQTGEKAKTRHAKKLPACDALDAMAEIFANRPTCPRDIFTSSLFAMSLCAPSRASELLALQVDCEHKGKDSKGRTRYGWRFDSGKGFGADIKWIPTEMVAVAKEAVSRIQELTEAARQLAAWLESGNEHFFPHEGCPSVSSNTLLAPTQAAAAIGLSARPDIAACSLRGFGLDGKNASYSLDTLWKEMIVRNADILPWYDEERRITYSKALFCMTRNLLHKSRPNLPVVLWRPSTNILNRDLDSREIATRSSESIFERHGYESDDGSPLKLTSHQARHLIDTIAQRGGLSQSEIAKWAGRASTSQNRVYNHMNEFEMVARVETLGDTDNLFGPVEAPNKHPPITADEAARITHGATHVTEFGICVHDYTISPCDRYRDCLNCEEQVCIKGNEDRLKRMRTRLAEVEEQLAKSEVALKSGLAGADRWHEYHMMTESRLSKLVEILEDPELEDGSFVRLENGNCFSVMRRAIDSVVPTVIDAKHGIEQQKTRMLGADYGETPHKA